MYAVTEVSDISLLPIDMRPREKLINRGAKRLTDHELLTIFLGSGSRYLGVSGVAAQLLKMIDTIKKTPEPDDFGKIHGIGTAKATQLCAIMEFTRRRFCPSNHQIQTPSDALRIVQHFADRPQEHFLSLSLNGAHELIAMRVVSIGLVNRSLVHPREVFSDPLTDRAAALLVAHNHPSGNLEPSPEDREVTKRLRDSGEILGIKLLDHVVFTSNGYYSFLESEPF